MFFGPGYREYRKLPSCIKCIFNAGQRRQAFAEPGDNPVIDITGSVTDSLDYHSH